MASQDTTSNDRDGGGSHGHDDDTKLDALSSHASTPMTTSPESHPFVSLADQTFTPLSLVDDQPLTDGSAANRSGAAADKPTVIAPDGEWSADAQRDPSAPTSGRNSGQICSEDLFGAVTEAARGVMGDAKADATAASTTTSNITAYVAGSPSRASARLDLLEPCVDHQRSRENHQGLVDEGRGEQDKNILDASTARGRPPQHEDPHQDPGHCSASTSTLSSTSISASTSALSSAGAARTQRATGTAAPSSSMSPGHGHGYGLEHGHFKGRLGHDDNIDCGITSRSSRDLSSSYNSAAHPPYSYEGSWTSSPLSDFLPLRTGSVQPDTTQLVRPRPIVRTISDNGSFTLRHPKPDLNTRSGSYTSNIAQLEATAERLSMTSSIADAIRDLHSELKRSDSRRSSILAASRKGSVNDDNSSNAAASAVGQLKRHISNSSSIVSTNIAARHGGYSPAAYVMSPSHSLTGRLRSGSKNSTGRSDIDVDTILSRHGSGKVSVRSIRSTKMSLAEISESEPIALNKDAFDKADAAPPLKNNGHDNKQRPAEFDDANIANTDVFHKMMGDDDFLERRHVDHNGGQQSGSSQHHQYNNDVPQRPGSAGSENTFQQCQNAFGDFDGVHWVPEHNDDPYAPSPELDFPVLRVPPPAVPRPQSYMDPETGQQMLYYPARVPAMLNLPPKLSNKPKASQRNNRRSQVLSAMMDNTDVNNRQSQHLEKEKPRDTTRDSFLPDPLAGHRNSFAALSSHELHLDIGGDDARSVRDEQLPVAQTTNEIEAGPLRRPPKLSQTEAEKRKSRMSRLDNLPPQLRASAYFDMPSVSPQIEVKDGSAMATLDSILDASTTAPVSAFTDHSFAGKLGSETYGKEKKRASLAPSAALHPPSAEPAPKKRSSFLWLKRGGDDKKHQKNPSDISGQGTENDAMARSADGESVIHHEQVGNEPEKDEDSEVDEDARGPPTTLLAELQMRKYQQKKRTQMSTNPEGLHATLLEMDAVAETQRKARKGKRVNLAWEGPGANPDDDDSDDEDVPLALIAARNQGAQSMLDLNRPVGLMEKRELEENEPLSHRKARLAGQDPRGMMLAKQQSMVNLSAPFTAHSRSRSSFSRQAVTPEPDDDEFEGETLAERRRRLAAKDEAENPLPKARPVSGGFSAELLSQFGDLGDKKEDEEMEKTTPKGDGEEETLGQRRRRLQSEREAREREMNTNNLDGTTGPQPNRRLNMAGVLAAHPKREQEQRAQEERRRVEEERRRAREHDAKVAALRSQMPTTLTGPEVKYSGGFRGGVYNDGTAGFGVQAARSSPALHTQGYGSNNLQHRASAVFSSYGTPMQQPNHPYGAMNNGRPYSGVPTLHPYGNGAMNVYGGVMQPGMQPAPMDRVEQWRQGVLP